MASSVYIEDIFVEFAEYVDSNKISINPQDVSAIHSFYNHIINNSSLTQSQGNLLIKFLHKYQPQAIRINFDYTIFLSDPQWRMPFRFIDLGKRVWVENDEDKITWVCLKFPYQLKKEFDDEFGDNTVHSIWDSESRVRKLILYRYNLIHVYEFAKKHNFEIDDTFLVAVGDVEEIWQNQDDILPSSDLIADWITLFNNSEETESWWWEHKTGCYENDLLLAKSMGYPYVGKPHSIIEKIAAAKENVFWLKDTVEFLNICNQIQGKVCILLDRAGKSLDWLEQFDLALVQSSLPRDTVRVCFRADKEQGPELNQWIKDHGFGGKIDGAKVLIFNHKPAKWLFKEQESVKIIASNNIYSPTNTISRDWFNSHPCVIYIGDIKPTMSKDQKIVEL
jgi:hypothetical protein